MKIGTRNRAVGAAKNIAGTVKKVTGQAVGNPRLEVVGQLQQAEGRTQKKIGEVERILED